REAILQLEHSGDRAVHRASVELDPRLRIEERPGDPQLGAGAPQRALEDELRAGTPRLPGRIEGALRQRAGPDDPDPGPPAPRGAERLGRAAREGGASL